MAQTVVTKQYTIDGLDLRHNEATGRQIVVLRAHTGSEVVEVQLPDAALTTVPA